MLDEQMEYLRRYALAGEALNKCKDNQNDWGIGFWTTVQANLMRRLEFSSIKKADSL